MDRRWYERQLYHLHEGRNGFADTTAFEIVYWVAQMGLALSWHFLVLNGVSSIRDTNHDPYGLCNCLQVPV